MRISFSEAVLLRSKICKPAPAGTIKYTKTELLWLTVLLSGYSGSVEFEEAMYVAQGSPVSKELYCAWLMFRETHRGSDAARNHLTSSRRSHSH